MRLTSFLPSRKAGGWAVSLGTQGKMSQAAKLAVVGGEGPPGKQGDLFLTFPVLLLKRCLGDFFQ